MLRVTIDPSAPDLRVIEQAAAAIREGRLVAGPTDTLYGLLADPHNGAALDALYALKGRPSHQALPLVAAGRAQVEAWAGPLAGLTARMASRFWPGPLTLLVPAWEALDARVHGGSGAVGVRVPGHTVARALAEMAGRPLVATSANRSGEPAVSDAGAISPALGAGVAILLDAGPTAGGLPSTIVDGRGRSPELLRAGAVPWARVLESLE